MAPSNNNRGPLPHSRGPGTRSHQFTHLPPKQTHYAYLPQHFACGSLVYSPPESAPTVPAQGRRTTANSVRNPTKMSDYELLVGFQDQTISDGYMEKGAARRLAVDADRRIRDSKKKMWHMKDKLAGEAGGVDGELLDFVIPSPWDNFCTSYFSICHEEPNESSPTFAEENSSVLFTSVLFFQNLRTDSLKPLELSFSHIDLFSSSPSRNKTKHYAIQITRNLRESDGIQLTILLSRPPKATVTVNGVRRRATERDWDKEGGYELDESAGNKVARKEGRKVSSWGERSELRLSKWFCFRYSLPREYLQDLQSVLSSVKLTSPFVHPSSYNSFENLPHSRQKDMVRYFSTRRRRAKFTIEDLPICGPDLETLDLLANLDWMTWYHVESLLCKGVIIDQQLAELLELLPRVEEKDKDGNKVMTDRIDFDQSQKILRSFQRYDRIFELSKEFKSIGKHLSTQPLYPVIDNAVYVPKIVITPLRVLLHLPEAQTSNLVLRLYPKEVADWRFARVQFWDEGNRIVTKENRDSDELDFNEGVFARFLRARTAGLFIAGRTFYYLDSSASQMRTNAFWAICEIPPNNQITNMSNEPGNILKYKTFTRQEFVEGQMQTQKSFTRKEVRNCLGNYDDERVIAKLAARRGQMFSTTWPVGNIKRVRIVNDYKTDPTADGKQYTFTDGVGLAHEDIVKAAADRLGMTGPVSTVQFRMGGSKGIVVAWKSPCSESAKRYLLWPKIRPSEVWLRPSMMKFKSSHSQFAVIRVSGYRKGLLNREVLSVLFPRGVDFTYLIEMFKTQVDKALTMEDEICNQATLGPWQESIVKLQQFPLYTLLKSGFSADPLVRSIIRLLKQNVLFHLKWKCWIELEQSFNGLGAVDEIGVLQENQIYCRTVDDEGNEHTIQGKCIIWRAPVRHPGDVQIVEAVDHEALKESGVVNTILFNRKGPRDLANKLGGGDLDGDDYTVCWDPKLIPKESVKPMDYEGEKPQKYECIDAVDIKEFHYVYMKEDNLGEISNAHLAMSDYLGPFDTRAIQLAELHSTAVDFAKTGIPAVIPSDLRPDRFPDFMGPRRKGNTYKSDKPLGVMFRDEKINPLPIFKMSQRGTMDPRLKLALDAISLPEEISDQIRVLKAGYDEELETMMAKFQCTEAELVSGRVLPLPGGLNRLDKDQKLEDPVRMAFKTTRLHYEQLVQSKIEALKSSRYSVEENKERLALAAYSVTFESLNQKKGKNILLSFPWIWWGILVNIAKRIEGQHPELSRTIKRQSHCRNTSSVSTNFGLDSRPPGPDHDINPPDHDFIQIPRQRNARNRDNRSSGGQSTEQRFEILRQFQDWPPVDELDW